MKDRPPPSTGSHTVRPPPLIQMLIQEAHLRGDTLASLARQLGVSYRRFAQWQNASADIRTAQPDVFTKAAGYLQLPRVTVLAYAGVLTLQDLARPQPLARDMYLYREMEKMRQDPAVGPFMPQSLPEVSRDVQTFVAFLYNESRPGDSPESANWFRDLFAAVTVGSDVGKPSTSSNE
ncbi:hypothetical protein SAMN04489710_102381 [Paracidovorax konjaci]|uniref:Uncharacterized protein n=2 Tax=Paracidovorax konjaci TaxID=32040 RepID=A0A1I1SQ88_9BURK|nr:hypothetical protein SAMN04489710_102381 [Paracidovorax konjaci]